MHRFTGVAAALALAAALCACTSDPAVSAPSERNSLQPTSVYYPPPGDAWERKKPEDVGMDPGRLQEAVAFARRKESRYYPEGIDPLAWHRRFARGFGGTAQDVEVIGPVQGRGKASGIVLRHGYIVAEFGDTARPETVFSATKSFLSAVAGIAHARGALPDVHQPVCERVKDGGFDSLHNRPITWHHLLQQTSEWEGTLWGKKDAADRRRGRDRKLQAAGTFWEYNDVRVNRLALCLLRVLDEPLPEVLKEGVMAPIGSTDTWTWHGYQTSDVEVGGRTVKSVSGGAHWGGGLWMNTRDLARFGYLYLREGRWGERQILPKKWIDKTLEPCPLNRSYGYLWWLGHDTGGTLVHFSAQGAGGHFCWVVPERDLVIVVQWMAEGAEQAFLSKVIRSIRD